MEIADSARKHGVSDEDVEHAACNAIVSLTNDSGEKVLLIGPALDGPSWRWSCSIPTTTQLPSTP